MIGNLYLQESRNPNYLYFYLVTGYNDQLDYLMGYQYQFVNGKLVNKFYSDNMMTVYSAKNIIPKILENISSENSDTIINSYIENLIFK